VDPVRKQRIAVEASDTAPVDSTLRLAPSLATSDLNLEYLINDRIHIPGILDASSADAIYRCLSGQRQWNVVFNNAGQHVDASDAAIARWPLNRRTKLKRQIYAQASHHFQYHYCAFPIYDVYHKGLLPGHFLNLVLEFLNSKPFIDFARTVTGDDSIRFADAQATCYKCCHFLTRHDDNVEGKNRRAAYVLNMTRGWRADWGGALQFFGPQGHIEKAFTPTYNALNLFRVPTDHSVGIVAPFAGAHRYSITGWLRNGKDPMAATDCC